MAFVRITNNTPVEIKNIETAIQETVQENLSSYASINSELMQTHRDPRQIPVRKLIITIEVDVSHVTFKFNDKI